MMISMTINPVTVDTTKVATKLSMKVGLEIALKSSSALAIGLILQMKKKARATEGRDDAVKGHIKEKAVEISLNGLYLMPATTYSPTHFRVQ
jgi:hypothetical protein